MPVPGSPRVLARGSPPAIGGLPPVEYVLGMGDRPARRGDLPDVGSLPRTGSLRGLGSLPGLEALFGTRSLLGVAGPHGMGGPLRRGNWPGIRHRAPRVQRPRLAHRERSVSRDDLAER